MSKIKPATTDALTSEQRNALALLSYDQQQAEKDPLRVEAEKYKKEYNKRVKPRINSMKNAGPTTKVVDMRGEQEERWAKENLPLSDAELARRKEVERMTYRIGEKNWFRAAKRWEKERLKSIRQQADDMRKKEEQRRGHRAFGAKTNPPAAPDAHPVAPTTGAPLPKKKSLLARFFGKGGRKRGRKRITRKKRGGRKRKNKTKTKRKTLRKSHKKRRKMARRKKTKRRR